MGRLVLLLSVFLLAAPGETLTGTVVDASGAPVADARVRLRTAETFAVTGADGRFVLADPASAPGREITAARPGHIIGGTTLKDGVFDYHIELSPIPAGDDATYPWVTAIPEDDQAPRTDFGREPCGACHRRILAEWQASAHARTATNTRFLAFFDGRNSLSFKSTSRPATEGCGNCHTPMAANAEPRAASGVGTEGVGCDFCHKIAEARPSTADRSGIRAVELRRPPFGRQAIFGPFDDVPRGRDVFAPVFSESRYCASCHQQHAGDIAIYSEFEEWQRSPYAAAGTTCQSCHMRGDGMATTMSDLGPGRVGRVAARLSSHRFHDSLSPQFAADAARTEIVAHRRGEVLEVTFAIANSGGGHHLPAGSPMRHMTLVVEAEADGRALELLEGPTLPDWSGPGLSGKPGRAYAKLLRDATGALAPHWRATAIDNDTRIPSGAEDRTRYRFRVSGEETVKLTARLSIRRTFAAWAEATGTDTGEIEIARYVQTLAR